MTQADQAIQRVLALSSPAELQQLRQLVVLTIV